MLHNLQSTFRIVQETALLKVSRSLTNNAVVLVQFNTPHNLNALTDMMGNEFRNTISTLSKDNSIRALILSGVGRAFSAGGDLQFLHQRTQTSAPKNVDCMREFYAKFLSIRNVPFPTIAAINGHAVGAGLCLALACDLRIVSDTAKVGLNFSRIGISPGMLGSLTLPVLVGQQHAAKMILTGDLIDADEAVSIGLALKKVDSADCIEEAFKLAHRISEASPVAVRSATKMIRQRIDKDMEVALQKEADAQAICYSTEDLAKGLQSIAEKKSPVFKDFS